LDTWFSSGLWPFSTLGWPEETRDLARYYPTTVLETGYDIIFFWVARMIVSGLKFTGKIPFKYVYLHGLVRDEQGRKMSKSLGNVLDPLDLIAEYGADALRFTLLTAGTPGNDMKLSLTRVESNRNFANKLWNAARFVILNLEGQQLDLAADVTPYDMRYALPDGEWPLATSHQPPATSHLGLAERWILSRLQSMQNDVSRLINEWQLGEAGRQLYDFIWSEYCDWYIEAAKVRLAEPASAEAQATRQVLAFVLEQSLRLLHPYMPFVTETIWQNLPDLGGDGRALMVSRWPQLQGYEDEQANQDFGSIQEIVRAIRNARSEYNVPPGRRIAAQISAGAHGEMLSDNSPLLARLAGLDATSILIAAELPAPVNAVTLAAGGVTTYLPLAGLVDLAAERTRLQKEIDNIDKQLQRIDGLLANSGFVNKAPAEVIDRERNKLGELQGARRQLVERLAVLSD
jgi:valyl-tRNA synthetase